VEIGYNEPLAHAVVAGADVILVPSRFEPCGLTQLYGLRYGSLPLVHRVGGLADTVVDATAQNLEAGRATGFAFDEFSTQGLRAAVRRAVELHAQPDVWAKVQQTAMKQRFDWREAARRYVALYRSLKPHAA
jgi:starch synthase